MINDSTVSVAEAARTLGINVLTLRRSIARGEIPFAQKVGSAYCISREGLERWRNGEVLVNVRLDEEKVAEKVAAKLAERLAGR